jgi:hypothetical protein
MDKGERFFLTFSNSHITPPPSHKAKTSLFLEWCAFLLESLQKVKKMIKKSMGDLLYPLACFS